MRARVVIAALVLASAAFGCGPSNDSDARPINPTDVPFDLLDNRATGPSGGNTVRP